MVADQMMEWIKKNKSILFIVFLALFLRLFKISSYMTFLGDEGRDALVWLRMLHGKFTLIGPQTSIGNMYLGPLYYYLMFPFYILMGTVGPSVGIALFAGATTFLLWRFGREWFSERVGLLAAFFYAISPVAIVLSRSSWNPNVMPFFSLLIIWGIWQFWQKEKYYWLAIEGIFLSFAVQSHYLGLLLFPVVGIFFLVKLVSLLRKKDQHWRKLCLYFLLLGSLFLIITFLPLIWFDLRHNFINFNAFRKFFSERQTTVNLKVYKAIPQLWPLWKTVVTRLLAGKNEVFGFWLAMFFPPLMFFWFIRHIRGGRMDSSKVNSSGIFLLLVWLGVGLLGMGLYKQHIYDHYFGFLFPAIFLIFSAILEKLWNFKVYGRIIAVLLFSLVVAAGIFETPLKYQPNFQMKRTAEVTENIIKESENKPFNLGMIAKQNYDAGYRYFLEKKGHKALEIDAQKSGETISEQLFVVCEEKECNPTTHPQAEIANFGWSKIDREWEFPWGAKLFKLVHNIQGE